MGPDLYRINAFRVLGALAQRPIAGFAASLPLLPLDPAPDPSGLTAARARLASPVERSFDAFFWFWPIPGAQPGLDKALSLLARGNWRAAAEAWQWRTSNAADGHIARHNLAVLFHSLALDIEISHAKNTAAAPELRFLWSEALGRWSEVIADDALWGGLEQIDGSLSGVGHALRAALPDILLAIQVKLAAEVDQGLERWRRHVALIRGCSFPSPAREKALAAMGSALRRRCLSLLARAVTNAAARPNESPALFEALLGTVAPLLQALAQEAVADHESVASLADEVCRRGLSCLAVPSAASDGSARARLITAQSLARLARAASAKEEAAQAVTRLEGWVAAEAGRRRHQETEERCSQILLTRSPLRDRFLYLSRLLDEGRAHPEAVDVAVVVRALRALAVKAAERDEHLPLAEEVLEMARPVAGTASAGVGTELAAVRQRQRDREAQLEAARLSRLEQVSTQVQAIRSASVSPLEQADALLEVAAGLRGETSVGGLVAEGTRMVVEAAVELSELLEQQEGDAEGAWAVLVRLAPLCANDAGSALEARLRTLDRVLLSDDLQQIRRGRSKELVEAAYPDLLQRNAFRLTGTGVAMSQRQVERRVQELQMLLRLHPRDLPSVGPLPVPTAGDADRVLDALKAGAARLREPEVRLIDELFWLWDTPASAVPSTPAGLPDAMRAWQLESADRNTDGVAGHNLGVVHLALALDAELVDPATVPSAPAARKRDEDWLAAVSHWRTVMLQERFWWHLGGRLARQPDGRLGVRYARWLKHTVPVALALILARLVFDRISSRPNDAERLVPLFRQLGFPMISVSQDVLATSLSSVFDRVKHGASRAREEASSDPERASAVARELRTENRPILLALEAFFGEERVAPFRDDVATAMLDCVTQGPNVEAEDVLVSAEALAAGRGVRKRIAEARRAQRLEVFARDCQSIVEAARPLRERFSRLKAVVGDPSAPQAGDDDEFASGVRDIIALSMNRLALEANNQVEDFDLAIEVLAAAETLARSADVRRSLGEGRKAAAANQARGRAMALAKKCDEIAHSGDSLKSRLLRLQALAEGEVTVLVAAWAAEPEMVEQLVDHVAGAIGSLSIDLANKKRDFKAAVQFLQFALSIARGAEKREWLSKNLSTGQQMLRS